MNTPTRFLVFAPACNSRGRISHRRKLRRSSAFTLLELLIVVFIIGILVALTVVTVTKVKRAVYGAATQAQLSALANAIQQYYNDYKAYPGPLPNSQLCTSYDGNLSAAIIDTIYNTGTVALTGTTGTSGSNTMNSTASAQGFMDATHITGAENLVLGLLGGLRASNDTVNSKVVFEYHPEDIFNFDGVTPNPHGPASLNLASPRRQNSYIQIKAGDISVPNNTVNNGQYTDAAGRAAAGSLHSKSIADSIIPEFLDKYADPLPILYFRTNVGAPAIVGVRVNNLFQDDNSNTLVDVNGQSVAAQYDLLQNLAYTISPIGTIANNPNSYHGLQGLGGGTTDLVTNNIMATPSNGAPYGASGALGYNAIAYLTEPSSYDPMGATATIPTTDTHLGVPRQKDGFLLISAGPDRLYGTVDDNIFPGTVVVSQ